ncbi:hypothetical protein EDB19DRAFT_1835009 [Suillus lakei]|nr:hypothetical protein EDB19DRAFT_1835009 [Suillus lakei]
MGNLNTDCPQSVILKKQMPGGLLEDRMQGILSQGCRVRKRQRRRSRRGRKWGGSVHTRQVFFFLGKGGEWDDEHQSSKKYGKNAKKTKMRIASEGADGSGRRGEGWIAAFKGVKMSIGSIWFQ